MVDGGAAAAAAAIAQAIKASGAIVSVEPEEFAKIFRRAEKPLVVYTGPSFFSRKHSYLLSYKGLVFHTKSREEISFSRDVEVVVAKKIWVP
jgi:hypothetical protein